MNVKNQTFFVLGVSKSGCAVAEHVLAKGGKCYIFDQLDSEKVKTNKNNLLLKGAINVLEENVDQILEIIDVLVVSPGVPINHEIAVKAKRKGKYIIGELEFAYQIKTPLTVAVTGTNGKTTTCTLINEILKKEGLNSFLLGNVGEPVTAKNNEIADDSLCVVEVSSFQLETVNSFCPHISCVLNIAPDHLERHYSMENYVFLKKRIFKNQREGEYCILNYDDLVVRNFDRETRAKTVWVSCREKVNGAYLLDGNLYYKDEIIISENEIVLKGEHNLYNVLFAIGVAKLLGVSNQSIISVLKTFKGVRHRIETVENKDGVTFYNDSKATNVASTLSAVKTMEKPTVLILGGSEKGECFDELFSAIKNSMIKQVVITGATRFKMLESAKKMNYESVSLTPDFESAVKLATILAGSGENVLLSPACASFDCFNGYEERGEKFEKIVRNLD